MLEQESIPLYLAYLRRAAERRSPIFNLEPIAVRNAVGVLHQKLQDLPKTAVPLVFNDWLAEHVTSVGRARMLSTLRRKRADLRARGDKARRRTLTLPAETMVSLEALAKQTGGLPVTKLLAAFAAIAQVEPELRERLLRLAVAVSL